MNKQAIYTVSLNNASKKLPENYNELVIPQIENATTRIMGDLVKSKIYNYIIYYFNLGKTEGILDSLYIWIDNKTKRVYFKIEDNRIVVKLINEEV
mgnify:CR=1 FL=1